MQRMTKINVAAKSFYDTMLLTNKPTANLPGNLSLSTIFISLVLIPKKITLILYDIQNII